MFKNKGKIFSIISIFLLSISSCSNAATNANLKFECPMIETSTTNLRSTGNLILRKLSGGIYQMNMATRVMTQINKPNEVLQEFSVSPNQKRVAYLESMSNRSDFNLIIAGTNNQIYKTLLWEDNAGWGAFQWLDNEHLAIELLPQNDNVLVSYVRDFLILNPFTGERQILKTDYPNVYDDFPMPDWAGWGITAYNQNLTRAVYLERDASGPFYYVLWDLQKKSQIQ